MDLTKAYKHCARTTRKAGSSFYYGMRMLPLHKRMAMFAIYAWSRICDDAVDDFQGACAKQHLQRAEDIYLAAFEETYLTSRDPIVCALGDAVRRFGVPKAPFAGLLQGMRIDIDKVRFQTYEELEKYCEYVAGTIGEMCVCVFGYRDKEAFRWARDMGIALQLTNILRDISEDIKRERVYLPEDEMNRAGYSLADLKSRRMTPSYEELMRFQVERAYRYYEHARNLFPLIDTDSTRCLRVLYLMYYELLRQIEESGFRVFDQRIRVSGSRKLQLLWGALWNASTII